MAKIKAWHHGTKGEPYFPEEFQVLQKAVLQVTDIKTNHNKYYAIELHSAESKGKQCFRVFTHYGRTDDLENNPAAGRRECRYLDSLAAAEGQYRSIYRQKTSPSKGYQEVNLASSRIGSHMSVGQSSGEIDDKTLQKLAGDEPEKVIKPKPSALPEVVQELVRYIYAEATDALTSTVNAKITGQGIETPLGILTIGQIERGETILTNLFSAFKKKWKREQEVERLSGEFYSVIPHRIGRSRKAVQAAVIDTLEVWEQKQELLQLMKDMLQVNGDQNVLLDPEVDKKYQALGCHIEEVPARSKEYKQIEKQVVSSQIRFKSIKVRSIFEVRRDAEWSAFTEEIDNQRLLFHGSRIKNWVGILSRGVMMPKIVVKMGVHRTDAGWLGNGIYFGDAACTSSYYTTPGRRKTRLMGIHRVALGKIKEYRKITYGIEGPPSGYLSCHGVRRTTFRPSQFDDDEFVIYDPRQQRQEYLVEFKI
jgi:poly [ADP-ribose] polymerase